MSRHVPGGDLRHPEWWPPTCSGTPPTCRRCFGPCWPGWPTVWASAPRTPQRFRPGWPRIPPPAASPDASSDRVARPSHDRRACYGPSAGPRSGGSPRSCFTGSTSASGPPSRRPTPRLRRGRWVTRSMAAGRASTSSRRGQSGCAYASGCQIGVLGVGSVAAVDVSAVPDPVGTATGTAGSHGVHQVDSAVAFEHDRVTRMGLDCRDQHPSFRPELTGRPAQPRWRATALARGLQRRVQVEGRCAHPAAEVSRVLSGGNDLAHPLQVWCSSEPPLANGPAGAPGGDYLSRATAKWFVGPVGLEPTTRGSKER